MARKSAPPGGRRGRPGVLVAAAAGVLALIAVVVVLASGGGGDGGGGDGGGDGGGGGGGRGRRRCQARPDPARDRPARARCRWGRHRRRLRLGRQSRPEHGHARERAGRGRWTASRSRWAPSRTASPRGSARCGSRTRATTASRDWTSGSGKQLGTHAVGAAPEGIVVAHGSAWVANGGDGTVTPARLRRQHDRDRAGRRGSRSARRHDRTPSGSP